MGALLQFPKSEESMRRQEKRILFKIGYRASKYGKVRDLDQVVLTKIIRIMVRRTREKQ